MRSPPKTHISIGTSDNTSKYTLCGSVDNKAVPLDKIAESQATNWCRKCCIAYNKQTKKNDKFII